MSICDMIRSYLQIKGYPKNKGEFDVLKLPRTLYYDNDIANKCNIKVPEDCVLKTMAGEVQENMFFDDKITLHTGHGCNHHYLVISKIHTVKDLTKLIYEQEITPQNAHKYESIGVNYENNLLFTLL